MLTNNYITVFHYDDIEEKYVIIYKGRAHVFLRQQNAPSNNGFVYKHNIIIRIPTNNYIKFNLGDYVNVGGDVQECIREECFKIIGYTDNRAGTPEMRHWRLDCE